MQLQRLIFEKRTETTNNAVKNYATCYKYDKRNNNTRSHKIGKAYYNNLRCFTYSNFRNALEIYLHFQPTSDRCCHFVPRENTRNPKAFWCFQGYKMEKLSRKRLRQSLFSNKFQSSGLKKETLAQVFPYEFYKLFKNIHFYTTPSVTASDNFSDIKQYTKNNISEAALHMCFQQKVF